MRYVIGLDLGTTCVKALLFDETGRIVSSSSEDDTLFPSQQDRVEQDASRWLALSAKVIRSIVAESGVDSKAVAALSISSQGITIVPVDESFKPLRSAINWLDQRAVKETELICSLKTDKEIYDITGKSINGGYSLPKILWLMRNEPDVFSRTHKILLPHDYLCAHFCGVAVTDHTMAGGTMLYDVSSQCWSDELLGLFEIEKKLLPEILWAGTPAGTLTKEAARLLGLSEDTLVVTGGQDQKVAAYGAHLQMGAASISLGTCAAMEFLFDTVPSHPKQSLAVFSYLEPGKWVMEACVNTAGAAIKWARDTLFSDLSYSAMDALGMECKTSGGVFFYPYLQGSGTPYNTSARGAFTGLTLGTSRQELCRAIMEGIVMEVRANLNSAEEAGVRVRDIYVFGGGSNSAFLNQMLADMTGRPIHTFSCSEMGSFGAARLAAKAAGLKDFSLPVNSTWNPDPAQSARYDEMYNAYRKNRELVFRL